jgi:LacI family transcriptional regulator, fructose operon transcriptional repressor
MTGNAPETPRRPNQATTIKDVARLAGVSVATVSRVLSDHSYVRDEVRWRVQKAIAELSYRPNRVARSLRAQRSKFIGLIISDIENPFYTALVRAVEDVAYARQYSLLLCNSDEDPEKERVYIEFMRDEQVAGVIASPTAENLTSLQVLIDAKIPVVAVDRRAKQTPVDTVMLDHAKSAYLLAKHLVEQGHTRIGMVIGNTTTTSGRERKRGFLKALKEAGVTPDSALMREVKPMEEAGFQAALGLLSLPNPPTALFIGNNLLTVGALKAIQHKKLRIPKDISLVGHDELPWMSLLSPGITVVAQPVYDLGRQAVDLLMARIKGDEQPPREIKLDPTLIIRQSVGQPAAFGINGKAKG